MEGVPYQLPPQFGSINPTKITQLAVYMPYRMEFSMTFYNQIFPSSSLTVRYFYSLKNLFGINGWRPWATSATVFFNKSNENHATRSLHALEEFIITAILPSTLPVIRIDKPFDFYTGKPVKINGWGPLATSATVWVYKSNENHATGSVYALEIEFSMQFYHQRFPSSTLINRSVYTLKNLCRIICWEPVSTAATVWVYKSNENHATRSVYALENFIIYSSLTYSYTFLIFDIALCL